VCGFFTICTRQKISAAAPKWLQAGKMRIAFQERLLRHRSTKKNCFQLYEEISANMNLAEFDEIGLSLREGILENHSLFMPETPAIHLYLPSPERTPAAPQPQWLRFSGLHRWSWL
jgi:hypothetical protein